MNECNCLNRVDIKLSCSREIHYDESWIKFNIHERAAIKGVNIRIYLTTVRKDHTPKIKGLNFTLVTRLRSARLSFLCNCF